MGYNFATSDCQINKDVKQIFVFHVQHCIVSYRIVSYSIVSYSVLFLYQSLYSELTCTNIFSRKIVKTVNKEHLFITESEIIIVLNRFTREKSFLLKSIIPVKDLLHNSFLLIFHSMINMYQRIRNNNNTVRYRIKNKELLVTLLSHC